MAESKSESEDQFVVNGIVLEDDMLFYGSGNKLEELASLASECIEAIETSSRPRTITIETWLFIDFWIREILMSGFGLNEYNLEEFDLRFEFLPCSFHNCLNLIRDLKREHTDLPRDPDENLITMSGKFFHFVHEEHPDFFDRFLEVEEQYYRAHYPDLVGRYETDLTDLSFLEEALSSKEEEQEYTRLPKGFISILDQINDDWLTKARRLNKARNAAAHTYDSGKILDCFGYSGPKAVEHLRDECIDLLRELIGVRKEEAEDDTDAT